MNTWTLPEVAEEHARAILQDLKRDPHEVDPYHYFLQAMDFIRPASGLSLLDVGCGCGHYGVLCERFYPGVRYYGTDISEHMIAKAKEVFPRGLYKMVDFGDNDFDEFDIVLASSSVEYAGVWPALKLLLRTAKHWVILHRVRLTDEPSHTFDEPTYAGQSAPHFVWNLEELLEFVRGCFAIRIAEVIRWGRGDHVTLILEKEKRNFW